MQKKTNNPHVTDITKYRDNLYDIKKRTEVIAEHLTGVRSTKYLVTEIEFLCLQFRKVLELIALSSLVANKAEYSKHHDKFSKHYNARMILQDLERINPNFYPVPTKQVAKEIDGQVIYDLQLVTNGFLTKEEFLNVYEKCGGMIHAENPYGQKRDINKIRQEFPVWLNKIITLLNHHNITLVDGETMIIGLMHNENGLPQAVEFKKVNSDRDRDIQRRLEKVS